MGVGLTTRDFVLFANMNDGQIFGGSVYKKVNMKLGKLDKNLSDYHLSEPNLNLKSKITRDCQEI